MKPSGIHATKICQEIDGFLLPSQAAEPNQTNTTSGSAHMHLVTVGLVGLLPLRTELLQRLHQFLARFLTTLKSQVIVSGPQVQGLAN